MLAKLGKAHPSGHQLNIMLFIGICAFNGIDNFSIQNVLCTLSVPFYKELMDRGRLPA